MDGEEIYIGYKDIFRIAQKRIYLFLIIVIITMIIALLYRILWREPAYETRVSLIIGSTLGNDQSQFQIQDINAVKESIQTYITILKTNVVIESAIKKLGLNMTPDELKDHIEAMPQPQTSFIEIKLKWNNSEQAVQILETIIDIFIMEATRIYPAYKIKILETVGPYLIGTISIKIYLLITLFASLVAALLIVLIVELFDNKLRTEEDINKHLNLPVLGNIPKQKDLDIRYSVLETYRTLRTNMHYISKKFDIQTIAITSAKPKEGKSISASLLAATFAQEKKITLLVDYNIKKPKIHEMFKIDLNGLTNILMGECNWPDVVIKSDIENLFVLPAGIDVFNSFELISSDNMKNLISRLRRSFDFIIFDTPHVGKETEDQVLSQYADGYLFVVAAGESNKDIVRKALGRLQSEGGRILGILMTKVPPEKKFSKSSL